MSHPLFVSELAHLCPELGRECVPNREGVIANLLDRYLHEELAKRELLVYLVVSETSWGGGHGEGSVECHADVEGAFLTSASAEQCLAEQRPSYCKCHIVEAKVNI